MKRSAILILLVALFISFVSFAEMPNGKVKEVVIGNVSGLPHPHMIDVLPTSYYYETNRMLTIEFPATGFEPYTLTVETVLTTQEYYVTTPFVSQYISPDVVNVDLYLETDGGDLYWGSFEATGNSSME